MDEQADGKTVTEWLYGLTIAQLRGAQQLRLS
jgi:hypothetical protein